VAADNDTDGSVSESYNLTNERAIVENNIKDWNTLRPNFQQSI
jgi:hypothetical protein